MNMSPSEMDEMFTLIVDTAPARTPKERAEHERHVGESIHGTLAEQLFGLAIKKAEQEGRSRATIETFVRMGR